ncbi:NAD-dependent epimerase [Flavihumibacter sp. UBA7668]|uniref:NAD-dependent epimerase n=1 Tax=Flavihumibacter sp. UBA7668 TaxID=1946542 RepID=UPI0025C162D9|nr:NAD-dependent epimerase [Flavihumibacter sp. UBA7668]
MEHSKKVLITGAAGFIGYHTTKKFLENGWQVIGIDNLNDYYEVGLKLSRLQKLGIDINEETYNIPAKSTSYDFLFFKMDLCDRAEIFNLFNEQMFDVVVNLAAQAGVRYSVENPFVYVDSNVSGFINVLEGCRQTNVKHLVYASTSSVYGLNSEMPFSPHNGANHPVSLYAATKKANEMMAHSYSHLYSLPTTGLRFFTVYGPWGRPDMALFLFTDAILSDKPINIYNNGQMFRDFTYVSDIVEGVFRISQRIPKSNVCWDSKIADPSSSSAPYKIFNIGNSNSVSLMEYINAIENALEKTAKKNYLPMQPGDVVATHADMSDLAEAVNYIPTTTIQEGVLEFVNWYKEYFNKK